MIVKLSQRIEVRSSSGGRTTSFPGGRSMRGRQEDTELFHKTFPFFIWLLRDVILSLPPDCKDFTKYFLTRVRYKLRLHHFKLTWCFRCTPSLINLQLFHERALDMSWLYYNHLISIKCECDNWFIKDAPKYRKLKQKEKCPETSRVRCSVATAPYRKLVSWPKPTVAPRGHAAILIVAGILNSICCNVKNWWDFKLFYATYKKKLNKLLQK